MFVSMVPSVELEGGSKNVSWITVNQCLNCNKCVAASWLSLCLYHDPMGFHSSSRGRTWVCMHHRSWPVATGGRTVPGFGIHGWSPLEEAATCEKRELITALVQVITVTVTGFY